jgi:hypothetical protein
MLARGRAGGGGSGLSSQDRILLTGMSPAIRRCAGTAVCEAAPLEPVETIREGPPDPDLTVPLAGRSVGATFTVVPRDVPRDKEGRQ